MSDNDNEDDAFAAGEAIARNFFEDYQAIDRAGALLFLLKAKSPDRYKNCEIMKVEGKYVVLQAGWFRSKPVPGFTLGRMAEVEKQLRKTLEADWGPATDEQIDAIVAEIKMWPLKN